MLFGIHIIQRTGFSGNPFAKHVPLLIDSAHFDQRLVLFDEAIDAGFVGDVATEVKTRARLVDGIFLSRLRYMW